MTDDLDIPGLHRLENGQTVLAGRALAIVRALDGLFLRWASDWNAEEYRFPPFIAAKELHRLDYFRSFPHQATFPVALGDDPEALRRFVGNVRIDEGGALSLGACAPVREVLTPAACYHLYALLQGRRLDGARTFTTSATCFRREARYVPLRRQWSFTMREIVRLGTAEEVQELLDGMQQRLTAVFASIDLPIEWRHATDPFFESARNPKFLAQTIDPVKTEMVFGEDLAIGSINVHRNVFGETFGIHRGEEPAWSGCVAFGIERWLFALLSRFGPDERRWPAALFEGGYSPHHS